MSAPLASGLMVPGSLPSTGFACDADAMRWLFQLVPRQYLRYVPTAEGQFPWVPTPGGKPTKDRRNWIIPLIESLRAHPDLEVVKEGRWDTGYKGFPRFAIRKGHTFRSEFINLDIEDNYDDHWAVWDQLCEEFGLSKDRRPPLLLSVKGDFDTAACMFGPIKALFSADRHVVPFREANAREIDKMDGIPDVVYQLELPIETISIGRAAPVGADALLADWLGHRAVKVIELCPPDARVGGHACNGDKDNQPGLVPRTCASSVRLMNNAAAGWPKHGQLPGGERVPRRPMEFAHIPLAFGCKPPPLTEGFYAPLARLRVQPSTVIVAGCLHPDRTVDEVRKILGWVNRFVGLARRATLGTDAPAEPVVVAPACGLGRTTLERAAEVLSQGVAMCETETALAGQVDG